MGAELRRRAETTDRELHDYPWLYRIKHGLDLLLPVVLLLILIVLYLEFMVTGTHVLSPYKQPLQLLVLGYFVAELGVDFLIYERARDFFRDRWLDILLTLPFFTAFKTANAALQGLTGLKLSKLAKTTRAGKAAKTGKLGKTGEGVKTMQKIGKLATKGKKLARKRWKNLVE